MMRVWSPVPTRPRTESAVKRLGSVTVVAGAAALATDKLPAASYATMVYWC
ncbi:MAG: hypothetical protein BWX86_02374 [Verrucomicrobia bacterium ADurb.Bin122]|nr:MAG: hypothetical protein BWX86_02374 [Verrucomicrobia bacterium ADurb.Bin122]